MSEVKVNKISPRTNCGTVTLGDSGDSIVIPSGVTITNNGTQTGFGRNGTVNWQTTIKTGDFTAVSGEGYFVNTSSGEIDVTLPASPSAGDIVAVSDYAKNSETNNIIIARNSSNIQGNASNLTIRNNGIAMTFVYADATKGWIVVYAGAESDKEPVPAFITASGGTETESGDFKIHTFTGPGTFTVTCAGNESGSNKVSYLVIAGGASGGINNQYDQGAGGGGAGGFRESKAADDTYSQSPSALSGGLSVTATAFPIQVGGGGAAFTSPNSNAGNSGTPSVFSSITSAGGGGGGSRNSPSCRAGVAGGSGGGGGGLGAAAGAGNTPPVSPPQGNNGAASGPHLGGGGGGINAVGSGGVGGAGQATSISGSPVTRAGGGGGGGGVPTPSGGAGGSGGGGAGGNVCGSGTNGTTNTGGGGGATGGRAPSGPTSETNGAGGSGLVIIRYKFQ